MQVHRASARGETVLEQQLASKDKVIENLQKELAEAERRRADVENELTEGACCTLSNVQKKMDEVRLRMQASQDSF